MSDAASSSILIGADPLEALLRHASNRLRALTAIASDPDVPAEDSATARIAIQRHIERTSGGRPAVPVDAAHTHLALERRLGEHAQAVSGDAGALVARIVAALPATAPAPAIALPARLTAALVALIAIGGSVTLLAALPVFSWLSLGQASLLGAILIASLRHTDTLSALRPMALVGTALTVATVMMGALLVPQFAMPMATHALAWGLFLIGFFAFAFSWSALLTAGSAIGWRATGVVALVAGHGLMGL